MKARPLVLYVPERFDPSDYIANPKHFDYACWAVSYIAGGCPHARDRDGWLPVPRQTWTNWIPSRIYAKAIQQPLIRGGVIECDNFYRAGTAEHPGKCLCFRLGRAWLGQQPRMVLTTQTTLLKALERARAHNHAGFLPVHEHLHQWLFRFTFDLPRALTVLAARAPGDVAAHGAGEPGDGDYWRWVLNVQARTIAQKQLETKVCPYGRFHSPFTSLPTSLRSCLTYRGEPLVGIDVVNSQPLLLCVLMHFDAVTDGALLKMLRQARTLPEALDRLPDLYAQGFDASRALVARAHWPELYEDATESLICGAIEGRFYENLQAELQIAAADRGALKASIFAVLYDNTHLYGPKVRFAERYAQVWDWTASVKHAIRRPSQAQSQRGIPEQARRKVAEHRTLCLLMQRLESWLFLEQACERLRLEHPKVPIITIHDSVLTTPSHVECVETVLRETLARWGVPALLKIEPVAQESPGRAA